MDKHHKRKRFGKIGKIVMFLGLTVALVRFIQKEESYETVSRALAARQISLVLSEGTIPDNGNTRFSAGEKGNWYVPYADYLYEKGVWKTEETKPDHETMQRAITVGEMETMEAVLWNEEPEEKQRRDAPVSKETWNTFYDRFLKECDPKGNVKTELFSVIGTSNQILEAKAWEVYTDKGCFFFHGLSIDGMLDKVVEVNVIGKEWLRTEMVQSEEVTYKNVWMEQIDETGMQVFLYGVRRTFPVMKAGIFPKNEIADLKLKNGVIREIALKKDRISGKIRDVGETSVEIEGYGSVPLADDAVFYEIAGSFAALLQKDQMTYYENAVCVAAKGEICGILFGEYENSEMIRVLLTDYTKGSVFHEQAVFTCDTDFTVRYGSESCTYAAGTQVALNRGEEFFDHGNIVIQPEKNGKICFTSFERRNGNPWYEGIAELRETEEGILIINEVDLETYLCYVVPSEMPESYGIEALKAQAVCARSYARRQMEGDDYKEYGAHVDDTTTYQVYNNTDTDDLTTQAVKETKGQVLVYQGEPVSTYYYATSSGIGNDMQVWGGTEEQYPYIRSINMTDEEEKDLSSEERFLEFLNTRDESCLEDDAPWYRWETTVSLEMLKERTDRFLQGYAKNHPDLVRITEPSGDGFPETLGEIKDLTVLERSRSGYINKLKIEGEDGSMEIFRPGTVRAFLGDVSHIYKKQDGSTATGKTILPSASIWLEKRKEEESEGYRIFGAGYGHGVGMSQTAASALASKGKSYKEILEFFYPGTEIAE